MNTNDFSKGSIQSHILHLALPLIAAQFVQVTYNIVDRIYIGHIPNMGTDCLSGLGLCFPLITLITAFTNLFGIGGAPLCSMARGENNEKKASLILSNTLVGLLFTSIALMFILEFFQIPILSALGASNITLPYASMYLSIYLIGTPLSMLATGLNGFINLQGYAKTGMMTVCIGALCNLILDPIFIFVLGLGIRGAALATVISQFISFLWVLRFFFGEKNSLDFALKKPDFTIIKNILALGLSGFVAIGSNAFVSMVINASLAPYGDVYIAVLTVINSVREVIFLPLEAMNGAVEPILSYNLGARCIDRVKQTIQCSTKMIFLYLSAAWILLLVFPHTILSLFTSDIVTIQTGIPLFRIYYCGVILMSGQYIGQGTFVGLNKPRYAIFFSILRKVLIILPLTLILPLTPLGLYGIFWAEPISNLIGPSTCYLTMRSVVHDLE